MEIRITIQTNGETVLIDDGTDAIVTACVDVDDACHYCVDHGHRVIAIEHDLSEALALSNGPDDVLGLEKSIGTEDARLEGAVNVLRRVYFLIDNICGTDDACVSIDRAVETLRFVQTDRRS